MNQKQEPKDCKDCIQYWCNGETYDIDNCSNSEMRELHKRNNSKVLTACHCHETNT